MSKSKDNLEEAFAKINKIYEGGMIGTLGNMPGLDVECFSTGSIAADIALGGGFPRGRIIEIFGPESSGKTTLTIHAMAEVQKAGGKAGIIDMEHAFDREYAKSLGVDVDSLVFTQPDSCEQAWEILEMLSDTEELDLIVVDSVAAMTPQRELDGDMGDAVIGLQAKLLRALQEKEYTPLGETKPRKFEAQIISASNVSLEEAVTNGDFRADLRYRLEVIQLHLPP